MILDVSPTRMELLRLRKRRAVAIRGHKLLKDKLDEFIRLVLAQVKQIGELRESLDRKLEEANRYMTLAGYATFPEAVTGALMTTDCKLNIGVNYRQILNVSVPELSINQGERSRSYGFVQTSVGVDRALVVFDHAIKDLIALAQREKTIQMIADEIRKTRRRVNALEYILIPNIEETIEFISMKLNEQERNRQTQLMRIKEVIRAPAAPTSAYPGVGRYPL